MTPDPETTPPKRHTPHPSAPALTLCKCGHTGRAHRGVMDDGACLLCACPGFARSEVDRC